MKSGTTSLFEILAQHPEVAAARIKEPRFFAEPDVWTLGWNWYQGLWDWDQTRHRIALEASPAYTAFPTRPGVPARIASVRGARFRFIYIMRNPLTQIESHVRHTLYGGWGRPVGEGIPDWMIDVVRYSMQIDQFLEVFPRDRMLLVTLEEFEQDPDRVLRRICGFLGVTSDFHFQRVSQRYNSGDAYQMGAAWARLATFKPLRDVAYRLLPRAYRHRLRSMFSRLPGRTSDLGRFRLTTEEQASLISRLAPDLRQLETEHGVDIGRFWSLDVTQ
jgi:hypothetical protein